MKPEWILITGLHNVIKEDLDPNLTSYRYLEVWQGIVRVAKKFKAYATIH